MPDESLVASATTASHRARRNRTPLPCLLRGREKDMNEYLVPVCLPNQTEISQLNQRLCSDAMRGVLSGFDLFCGKQTAPVCASR
jgi:hypothetical protein